MEEKSVCIEELYVCQVVGCTNETKRRNRLSSVYSVVVREGDRERSFSKKAPHHILVEGGAASAN